MNGHKKHMVVIIVVIADGSRMTDSSEKPVSFRNYGPSNNSSGNYGDSSRPVLYINK